jgi:kynurenine 3-monooxygenase
MSGSRSVIVVGGGLVGCVLSIYLARRGLDVTLYERNPDPRKRGGASRASINITLCERGWQSLSRIGLGPKIEQLSIPAYGRCVHTNLGESCFQQYGLVGQAIHSISRNTLHVELIQAAEDQGVGLRFDSRCCNIDFESAEVEGECDGHPFRDCGDCIFAADGCFSVVRSQLLKKGRFNYSQRFWRNGYKELRIPPDTRGRPQLEFNAIHLWPRGSYMAIAFPNLDGSFTCSLHLPFEGEVSFESIRCGKQLFDLFSKSFPDLVTLIPGLDDGFFSQEPNEMLTLKCQPWSWKGKALLLGDAAHAVLPSYGQGANASFEDCQRLDNIVEQHGSAWQKVFELFEGERRPNTDALADLCERHFEDLSNHSRNSLFQLRRRVESELHRLMPDHFAPLYAMVTFSSMPYCEAIQKDHAQTWVVDRLLKCDDIEQKLASGDFQEKILQWLDDSEGREQTAPVHPSGSDSVVLR